MKNNLREIRNGRGLSQQDLGLLSRIPPTDISRIENNWIVPYPGWRKRLARALKCPESYLFPGEGGIDGN